MDTIPTAIIFAGAVLIAIGLLWQVGGMLGLGKLPGDIIIEKQNVTVYIPIASSVIISIILSLIFYAISRFRQ